MAEFGGDQFELEFVQSLSVAGNSHRTLMPYPTINSLFHLILADRKKLCKYAKSKIRGTCLAEMRRDQDLFAFQISQTISGLLQAVY